MSIQLKKIVTDFILLKNKTRQFLLDTKILIWIYYGFNHKKIY